VDPDQHKASTRAAYERLATVWDDTDDNLWNEAFERNTVRRMIPRPLAGTRVLDAGCASGAHAAWFAEQGCEILGFDLSASMVRQARLRLDGRAQFVVADLEAPPFSDAAFDGILCSLALHYLKDVAVTLRHFARLLRPSGWLLITLDHPFGQMPGEDRTDYFTPRLVTDSWSKRGVEVTQSFWRRPLGAMVDDLADAGFVIERIGEPKLTDELRNRFPDDAAKIEGRPSFIAYLARHASQG
jgi:ubiquinone/menaquinone biosynthesis C-methylase UbiE